MKRRRSSVDRVLNTPPCLGVCAVRLRDADAYPSRVLVRHLAAQAAPHGESGGACATEGRAKTLSTSLGARACHSGTKHDQPEYYTASIIGESKPEHRRVDGQ
jgi:hypothetical protein